MNGDGDLDNTPQPLANEQVSADYPPGNQQSVGFSDRDNFVNDMVTILTGDAGGALDTTPIDPSTIVVPISPSAAGRTPVLTLAQIKLWLRIESSQTDEDAQLVMMECAARLYVETYIRRQLDPDALDDQGQPLGIGENIQQAMLLLIAEWYLHRELMVSGRLAEVPYAFAALLSTQRDYPGMY